MKYGDDATRLVFRRLLNGINGENFNRPFCRLQFQTKFLYCDEEGWNGIGRVDTWYHSTGRNNRGRGRQRHTIRINKAFLAKP